MPNIFQRLFRGRSLSNDTSLRRSQSSLNESSIKISSSISMSNLSSYPIDAKEFTRSKLHKATWDGKLRKVQQLTRASQVNTRDSQQRV
jgi:hypothetical protein